MGSMDLRRAGENDAQASGVGICVDGGAMLQGGKTRKTSTPGLSNRPGSGWPTPPEQQDLPQEDGGARGSWSNARGPRASRPAGVNV